MKTSDFYYDLPEELIAQKPAENRTESRLLLVDRASNKVEHRVFKDIIDYLRPGDALVLNDTKVFKARLIGAKESGGKIELFLLRPLGGKDWEALIKPAKRLKVGMSASFAYGRLICTVLGELEDGLRKVRLECSNDLDEVLTTYGEMPLPPYIKTKLKAEEENRYQTVYAHEKGSVAAPTAGLHFTMDLLDRIEQKGIKIVYLTLHVGLGTFRPVQADTVEEHQMHSEFYHFSEEAASELRKTKEAGGRIIAVGTTSTRVLESVYQKKASLVADRGSTDIFIYPGYEFKVIDGLITNFHLPESTLIMLVSAFYNRERVLGIYEEAVRERYRFFSFGDAMFLY